MVVRGATALTTRRWVACTIGRAVARHGGLPAEIGDAVPATVTLQNDAPSAWPRGHRSGILSDQRLADLLPEPLPEIFGQFGHPAEPRQVGVDDIRGCLVVTVMQGRRTRKVVGLG